MGIDMHTCPVDSNGGFHNHEWRQGQIKVLASEAYKRSYPGEDYQYLIGYYCIHCTEERPRK